MSVESHVAVQTIQLRHMGESLERIERRMGENVTRNEWEQRNGHVDGRFAQMQTEITAVKNDAENRRAPWWSVVGSVTAIAALALTLIPILAK